MFGHHDPAPLTVALVSDCYLPDTGGIEVQAHDLALQLVKAGHRVVVLTTTEGPTEVDGIRVIRIPVPRAQSLIPVLPAKTPIAPSVFRTVAEVLAAERVDVAHFHGGILSPLAFKGAADAQAAGIPTVITTHCLWSYATPAFALLDRRYRWSTWPVVFSAVSDVAAAPIRRIAGPAVDVSILPNGIDIASWAVGDPDEFVDQVTARAHGSTFTVAAVMRLAARKRPRQLIAMLGQLHDELVATGGPRLRALIVGDGGMRSSVERLIARRGLSDVVELTGRRTRVEIRDMYADVDAFVAPAKLESFGIAALEARTAGVPVVAMANTGVREFVEHGVEGLLATSDRDMVTQLLRLARDPALRANLAKHNAHTAPRVDWSDVVSMNVAAYRRAMALMSDRPGH
jgi:glycosyltransferase involved in cell wall biosynthesis